MSDEERSDFDVARAELFEAMGHPNRIRILKALSGEPLGFSELKRAVGMESSGLLSFHLQKLTHLVKTTPEGAYALTDDGKEALRIAETIRSNESNLEGKKLTHRPSLLRVAVAALLIGIIVMGAVAVYQEQQIGSLNHSLSSEQAGSVLINGTRYWQLSIPLQSLTLPATVQFDGVTFSLTEPSLNASGTVFVSLVTFNGTLSSQQGTVPLTFRILPIPSIQVRFADRQTESHSFVNSTFFQAQGSTVSVSLQPAGSPWFTHHSSPRAGAYLNSAVDSLELYLSLGM